MRHRWLPNFTPYNQVVKRNKLQCEWQTHYAIAYLAKCRPIFVVTKSGYSPQHRPTYVSSVDDACIAQLPPWTHFADRRHCIELLITRLRRPQPNDYLMIALKPHSNGPLYRNTVIGTLAVDGWAVTFGRERRNLSELLFHPVPSSLYQM